MQDGVVVIPMKVMENLPQGAVALLIPPLEQE